MNIPILRSKPVYHIGTMDKSSKAERFADSLEGHCLSVSRCPDAWQEIAEIGGALWELSKPNGLFLDVYKLDKVKDLRVHIEEWGIESGYAEKRPLWRAWNFDSETADWRYSLCETEEDARAEVDGAEDENCPYGNNNVEAVDVIVGTKSLCSRIGVKKLSDQDSFDFVAMVWAEDTQPAIDGIWWAESYAPLSLSAPRGGIFPSRLDRWVKREIQPSEWDGDDDRARGGMTCKLVPIEPALEDVAAFKA